MKILILNENNEEIEQLQEGLDGQDYQVIVTQDSDEVKDLITDEKPQILIADFHHPGFGGLDLVNHLLASDYFEYPYILFLVERDEEKQVVDSLGPIPGDFLFRPLALQELSHGGTIR